MCFNLFLSLVELFWAFVKNDIFDTPQSERWIFSHHWMKASAKHETHSHPDVSCKKCSHFKNKHGQTANRFCCLRTFPDFCWMILKRLHLFFFKIHPKTAAVFESLVPSIKRPEIRGPGSDFSAIAGGQVQWLEGSPNFDSLEKTMALKNSVNWGYVKPYLSGGMQPHFQLVTGPTLSHKNQPFIVARYASSIDPMGVCLLLPTSLVPWYQTFCQQSSSVQVKHSIRFISANGTDLKHGRDQLFDVWLKLD